MQHWERCQRYIERFLNEASQLVTRSRCGKDTRRNHCLEASIKERGADSIVENDELWEIQLSLDQFLSTIR